jgi:hypothetical protein
MLLTALFGLVACDEKPLLLPEDYYSDQLPTGKTYKDKDVFKLPSNWAEFYKVPTDSVKLANNLGYFKWYIAELDSNYYLTPRFSLNTDILKKKMLEYSVEDGKPVDASKLVIGWQSEGCDDTIKEFSVPYSDLKQRTGVYYYYPVYNIFRNNISNCNLYHKPCDLLKNSFFYFQNTSGVSPATNKKYERINDLLSVGTIAKKCN